MSSRPFYFLTSYQIGKLYYRHIGRAEPTQPHYLESALYSPQQHKNYGENDIFRLAGILSEKIILNHAYQDGNKRTALLAADMFLKINGYQLQKKLFTQDELDRQIQSAHVAVATKQWDAEQLASFYRSIATPISRITSEIEEYRKDSEQV